MKNTWVFPVVEAVHLIGLVLSMGTLALRDFASLGLGISSDDAARLWRWTRAGFVVIALTGLLMFFADVQRYLHNRAFLVKMALLAVAYLVARRQKPGWISLAAWSSVVLAARAIADFDA